MRRIHTGLFVAAVLNCALLNGTGAQTYLPHVGDHGFRPVRQSSSAAVTPTQFQLPTSVVTSQPFESPRPQYVVSHGYLNGAAVSVPPAVMGRSTAGTTPVIGSRTRRSTSAISFPGTMLPPGTLPATWCPAVPPNTTFTPYPATAYPATAYPASFPFASATPRQMQHPWSTVSAASTLGTVGQPQTTFGSVPTQPVYSYGGYPQVGTAAVGPSVSVATQTPTASGSRDSEVSAAPIHVYPPDVRLKK
ncbi:MAG: hypothetical protein R3C59_23505 [Planctomycetaceae bacterium]